MTVAAWGWALAAAAAAAGAAALVVVAELLARRWIRRSRRYHVWTPGTRRVLRLCPDISPHLEPVVHFSVNRDGERGAEVQPGPGLYRILVAGGSPVESLFHDQHTGWPALLEGSL